MTEMKPVATTQPQHPSFSPSPAPAGELLTTAGGVRLPDTDHSLKAGQRGPTVLEDFHFREKLTHFDHERIPERVVHARGSAARGTFLANGVGADVCAAAFLSEGEQTEVFVRFSTVLGSRGSADTVRDVRGFATKFYTEQGNFDLVGNNIPVFFIQDAIKFPDLIHAGKPQPDREIPQAQTAHDTFWDFVSLHTEATHTILWAMSDRAIPRSYRTMEGFGVHTFRLVNAGGESVLAKFHWKPAAGVHSLLWEEAQIAAGVDPDFHRRDLADAIENGAFPQWDLALQVFPDVPDQTFCGIDLLDPTKLVPEELAPVQVVGTMTLDSNPTNFFAETEQVAFHTGHLVPGVEVTDDPLLQGRMFSYLDTQLSRLGGPNFTQLPINRPHVDVNDNLRDGMHQTAVPAGVAPYLPQSLEPDVVSPRVATAAEGAYLQVARAVEGTVARDQSVSFEDHFTQATLFWRSMSSVEKDHIVEAFTFELGKCFEKSVRERMVATLARVDGRLCASVAVGLGLPVPDADVRPAEVTPSPALSQFTRVPGSLRDAVNGRVVGMVVADEGDLAGAIELQEALSAAGVIVRPIAPHGGSVSSGEESMPVDRTLLTVRSIEVDALVVADGVAPGQGKARLLLEEAFRHAKPIAAWRSGVRALTDAGIDVQAPGVLVAESGSALAEDLLAALARHRIWDRFPNPASM